MNKKLFYYLFAVLCMVTVFTSCDKNDDPSYPIDTEMAGTYLGDFAISIDGTAMGATENQKVIISQSAQGTNQLALSLKNFSFGTMTLGNIDVDPCQVTSVEGGYAFTGQQNVTLMAPIGTCPVTVNGTIKGNRIDINVEVSVPALNQDVVAVFGGTKLSGNESAEAAITAFTFDSDVVIEQPVIDESNKTIIFKVSNSVDPEKPLSLTPTVTVSDNATVTPASGVEQNFRIPVTYTVVAEDGTQVAYMVTVDRPAKTSMKFSFDEWTEIVSEDYVSYWTPEPQDALATSNGGVQLLNSKSIPTSQVGYPVEEEVEGYNGGKAAKLITLDARVNPLASIVGMSIVSGSLYTGIFKFNMFKPLASTQFGIVYDDKPVTFKGVYKYKAGDNYIDGSQEGLDVTDQCSIAAILYEGDVTLTGEDINTSDKIVAVARLADGSDKANWTTFELPFEWVKVYDSTKVYKLAIVCSSSVEGDKSKGAIGSTLIVDELEIMGE